MKLLGLNILTDAQLEEWKEKEKKSLFEQHAKKAGYLVKPWKGKKNEKMDGRKNKRMEFKNI